jgi:hypothetical protein
VSVLASGFLIGLNPAQLLATKVLLRVPVVLVLIEHGLTPRLTLSDRAICVDFLSTRDTRAEIPKELIVLLALTLAEFELSP